MRYEQQHPYFDFYFFDKLGITQEQVKKFSDYNYTGFVSLCKDANGTLCMTQDLNTKWIFRSYYAAKMIMVATLLLNNAEYCMKKNIMAPVPYLLYYAAFSSARGLFYVSTFTQEKSLDKFISSKHSDVINCVSNVIEDHVGCEIGGKVRNFLKYLKNQRELFSYKFPASGIRDEIRFDETVDICGLLAELTELSSYKIQEVYENNFIRKTGSESKDEYEWMYLNQDVIQKLYKYDTISILGKKVSLIDVEDFYRVNYIERKVKYPKSIMFTMTEGMTEDFFRAWCSTEDDSEGNFNSDLNWNRIYQIP